MDILKSGNCRTKYLRFAILAVAAALFALAVGLNGQTKEGKKSQSKEPFQDGCCVNPSFPRPTHVSQETIPMADLLTALNCATNNHFEGGVRAVAKSMGTGDVLQVAYYFGKYMPEQAGKALTVAIYSDDSQSGLLFDIDREKGKVFVENLPPLLRSPKKWRVGEINGGLWSYTRLWYLAQEIGTRPRQRIPIDAIQKAKPQQCTVFFSDETDWKPAQRKQAHDNL